jgi:hypothetical protein
MKKILLFLTLPLALHAQIDWKNYSTSFQGNGKEGSHPVLVTAIPYNGIYDGSSYGSVKPEAAPLADSLYTPGAQRPQYIGEAYTIDPNEVYFLAPGIHRDNAARYEFRVVSDGKKVFVPWGPITRFTDPGKALNEFKDKYGFLGGYKTGWGQFLLVDIREKATGTIESSTIVYWRATRPSLSAVYTARNLRRYFAGNRSSESGSPDTTMTANLHQLAKDKLLLQPGDNTLIFIVGTWIYQRQALEYQLLRDGSVDSAWKPNDFDNSTVFLQNLPPGNYKLQLRFRAQRSNVTSCSFEILPAWYATKLFRLLLGGLEGTALVAVILLFILIRQRRRTRREKAAREKLNLELGYIRSQLNPHFVFNALSSIQGLVNSNQVEAANRYLSDFGQLLRDSLAGSEKDTHPLQQEIRILDTYLLLEQLRFGFHYKITVAPDLPTATTEVPAFLLQPLVENAVKHGVSALHGEGVVQVGFSRENGNFIAEVIDNGTGWEPAPATETRGYGLRLTSERIRLLNQLTPHQPITMTTRSQPGMGSTIRLQFTNWWT